jgi:hypothetical protein
LRKSFRNGSRGTNSATLDRVALMVEARPGEHQAQFAHQRHRLDAEPAPAMGFGIAGFERARGQDIGPVGGVSRRIERIPGPQRHLFGNEGQKAQLIVRKGRKDVEFTERGHRRRFVHTCPQAKLRACPDTQPNRTEAL